MFKRRLRGDSMMTPQQNALVPRNGTARQSNLVSAKSKLQE